MTFAKSTTSLSAAEEKIIGDQFDLSNALHVVWLNPQFLKPTLLTHFLLFYNLQLLQSAHSERLYQVLELTVAKKSLADINDLLLPALMKVRSYLKGSWQCKVSPCPNSIIIQTTLAQWLALHFSSRLMPISPTGTYSTFLVCTNRYSQWSEMNSHCPQAKCSLQFDSPDELSCVRELTCAPLNHLCHRTNKKKKKMKLDTDYKDFLANETGISFEHDGKLLVSSRWQFIESFIATALKPDPSPSSAKAISHLSLQNFYSLIELVVEIVYATHLALVDRVWYLYLEQFVPFIADHAENLGSLLLVSQKKNVFTDTSIVDMSRLEEIFRRLPWYQATFHYSDSTAVSAMAMLPDVHGPIQRLIFTQLDWIKFADMIHHPNSQKTASTPTTLGNASGANLLVDFGFPGNQAQSAAAPPPPQPAEPVELSYRNKGLLYFLKLFFETNVDTPDAIPGPLRSRVLSISEDPNEWYNEGRYLFLWQKVQSPALV